MGFIEVMKRQVDPDGEAAHNQRQKWQDDADKLPPKKRFNGGFHPRAEPVFTRDGIMTRRSQREFDIETMKSNCECYKFGCQIRNCSNCKRKAEMIKAKIKRQFELLDTRHKEAIDQRAKREGYWQSEIAFDCPISCGRHTITDCFNRCEMWGRKYHDEDGQSVPILHCCIIAGEKELLSGNPTRPE